MFNSFCIVASWSIYIVAFISFYSIPARIRFITFYIPYCMLYTYTCTCSYFLCTSNNIHMCLQARKEYILHQSAMIYIILAALPASLSPWFLIRWARLAKSPYGDQISESNAEPGTGSWTTRISNWEDSKRVRISEGAKDWTYQVLAKENGNYSRSAGMPSNMESASGRSCRRWCGT